MDLRTDATKAAFFRCRRLVRPRLREMQDAWMIQNAEEIQGYADRKEMKNFFKAVKAIYGPCIKGTSQLLSLDGTTLLTEKSQILKRWAEHFRSVLNCSSAISDAAIDRLPQVDTNNDLDLPPSLPEIIRAVQQISSEDESALDAHKSSITRKSPCLHHPAVERTVDLVEIDGGTVVYLPLSSLNGLRGGCALTTLRPNQDEASVIILVCGLITNSEHRGFACPTLARVGLRSYRNQLSNYVGAASSALDPASGLLHYVLIPGTDE
ncbi:unnamed protein product [Schistocephalus solidus]|uniref:Uncharacterized protein n=1 Tax=Schistocephalus solidus TaxID=70667 RepID=A0A183SYT3_SCHSO|nr:unnamed protein product [Schistocephalus solidus]